MHTRTIRAATAISAGLLIALGSPLIASAPGVVDPLHLGGVVVGVIGLVLGITSCRQVTSSGKQE